MPRKTGLGRGLDALIPMEESSIQTGILLLPVEKIEPNPRQPRSQINQQELSELAESIRDHGVLQPIIVTEDNSRQGWYRLIAGERRLLAARQAGLETIPAWVREASEQESLELALIENVQRADLEPLETAEAYRQLVEDFKLSHEEVATRVGKSRTAITNTLRLLKLPEIIQQALAEDKISEGHARALLALAATEAQLAALQTILGQGLNVRQTEELVRRLSGEKPQKPTKKELSPEIIALEQRLRSFLGTKVTLNHHRIGGTITIHYYSEEELNTLVQQLMGQSNYNNIP